MSARKLAVYDCETDPFEYPNIPEPFLWCLYDGEELHYFDTTRAFVEYVRPRRLNLYAHNGGKFDALFLEEFLPSPAYPLIINGRIVRVKLSETCTLFDSYALYSMPLKATGEKKEIDLDKLHRKNRAKHMAEIREYCAADCVALYRMLARYKELMGNGVTHAGNSYRALKSLCDYEAKCSQEDDAKIRPYYFGGRTEVFQRYLSGGVIVDINSAYPWAMTKKHPEQTGYAIPVKSYERGGVGFYTVDAPSVGAFPLLGGDGVLHFPRDGKTRRFRVSSHEIEAARRVVPGFKFSVVEGYHFDLCRDFSPFVRHFFDVKARAEKGSIDYQLAKLSLNSPYGKLGQNPRNFRERCLVKYGKTPPRGKAWEMVEERGHGMVYETDPDPDALRFYNVAAAASVTGLVRAKLFEALSACRGVAYCDTDSIFCERPDGLKISPRLGDWSLEGEIDELHVGGKKLYCVKLQGGAYKVKSKGARLTVAQVLKVCRDDKTVVLDGAASKFSGSFSTGFQWRKKTIRRTV